MTSTTSPIKYKPFIDLVSKVFDDNSFVSTPPIVTSAVLYPSLPEGLTDQLLIVFHTMKMTQCQLH